MATKKDTTTSKKNSTGKRSGSGRKPAGSSTGTSRSARKTSNSRKSGGSSRTSQRRSRSAGARSAAAGNSAPKKRRRKSFKQRRNQYIRRIKKKIKANKLRFAVLAVGLIAIIALIFIHVNSNHEQAEQGDFVHQARFENYIVADGIDVSYAQGTGINWDAVKKSGIDFVFVRAGYRDAATGKICSDETFDSNVTGAKNAGLLVGAYFYSQAVSTQEAETEANFLLDKVAPYKIDLPLVMDIETYEDGRLQKMISTGLLPPVMMNKMTLAFCDAVEEAGYESMVYANKSFLSNKLDGDALADETNIWLAHYTLDTGYTGDFSFWQCSESWTVPGINGYVDKDFWYINPDAAYTTLAKSAGVSENKRISISDCDVTLKDHTSTYVGFNVEPGVTVRYKFDGLTEGKDYKVSYINNAGPGTGYAIVTGTGDYKDAVVTSFKIKKLI
jgi:GH25 family lysozyme M1 (1,4-beta-N-acetylmuramidase)